MNQPPVQIGFDPDSQTTVLDDRWIDDAGVEHGAVGSYPEPYGQLGFDATVKLLEAMGRVVNVRAAATAAVTSVTSGAIAAASCFRR